MYRSAKLEGKHNQPLTIFFNSLDKTESCFCHLRCRWSHFQSKFWTHFLVYKAWHGCAYPNKRLFLYILSLSNVCFEKDLFFNDEALSPSKGWNKHRNDNFHLELITLNHLFTLFSHTVLRIWPFFHIQHYPAAHRKSKWPPSHPLTAFCTLHYCTLIFQDYCTQQNAGSDIFWIIKCLVYLLSFAYFILGGVNDFHFTSSALNVRTAACSNRRPFKATRRFNLIVSLLFQGQYLSSHVWNSMWEPSFLLLLLQTFQNGQGHHNATKKVSKSFMWKYLLLGQDCLGPGQCVRYLSRGLLGVMKNCVMYLLKHTHSRHSLLK